MKTLEDRILARVRRIYLLRRLFGSTALKAYGFAVCVLALLSVVSVVNVVANMPAVTAPAALGAFFVNALTQTELLVQLLLVGSVVATLMLVRDLVRGSGRGRHHFAQA